MTLERDSVDEIIDQFSKCSNGSEKHVHFPVDSIGIVIWNALALRREIIGLRHQLELMEKQFMTK